MSVECCVVKLNSYFSVQKIWNALHGTLGKKISKTSPKACSKHVWTLLETILGFFGFLNFFDFSENFRRPDPPWNTGKKTFSKKSPQNMFRTWLNTLANDFGPFWIFEIFWRLDPPWNTGQKVSFQKKAPKHVWTLGNDFGQF